MRYCYSFRNFIVRGKFPWDATLHISLWFQNKQRPPFPPNKPYECLDEVDNEGHDDKAQNVNPCFSCSATVSLHWRSSNLGWYINHKWSCVNVVVKINIWNNFQNWFLERHWIELVGIFSNILHAMIFGLRWILRIKKIRFFKNLSSSEWIANRRIQPIVSFKTGRSVITAYFQSSGEMPIHSVL